MQKTYSQKVARVFEIMDYILLVPSALGLLLATLLIKEAAWFALLVYAAFGVGVGLMIGYFKHSRGRLAEEYIPALWMTSAIYNLILLLPCLFGAASFLQSPGPMTVDFSQMFVPFLIVLGYIFAITFSLNAYFFEKRKKELRLSTVS